MEHLCVCVCVCVCVCARVCVHVGREVGWGGGIIMCAGNLFLFKEAYNNINFHLSLSLSLINSLSYSPLLYCITFRTLNHPYCAAFKFPFAILLI